MINISFWSILWTVVNLLILFVAFRIFFFKPIANIIAKRQEEANEVYAKATAKETEANELAAQYEQKVAEAETEKKQIIADARKSADGQYQKIVAEAKANASEIKTAAATEANREKEQIIASAKKEIADIIVDATTKVVGGQTGAEVDSSLFDEFIGKAGE
ncbi:F-type H+-transporting ATPase subunit b [Pseudobutyrivibrio sp. OR37]|uniref:F0F1 ATP synthase subunit B n=1 Tax=Pseudobutyrivibrio sp. OR37 TaxID=1798186 RepID=UPI0008EB7CC3|nr:F0F1 ATP synthase subunit B [Pseudobutyrivibrio sp. OR37]SFI19286.1 F-type H+-transporting ATPase subunit b [Pseudobutyrivibrio sp. OR37]